MSLARIKKGDRVEVIAGKEKGKQGVVREVRTDVNRAVVEGLNVAKRHYKPGRARQAGIVEIELPIHVSNLMPLDPKDGKPTRVRTSVLADGKKVRVSARTGEQLDK